ncbi:hypothetical protein [Leptospira brenneri]|uniref:Nucleoside phosphorylase domain-containing protein n=1 Tax=Leptospira brenneri TaxID=2023182 RepID=A0A2M9Y6E8_9LEPT|nr:hypothetical protein [Leptospira brenneri]PJZ46996.1 hypothetical protein CH361_01200 [Leptospira brenneri]TGK96049.1 hypothetical protein EHQ30_05330 [Leptospira brenneri]
MKKIVIYFLLLFTVNHCSPEKKVVIIVSGYYEWIALKNYLKIDPAILQFSPYGEFFFADKVLDSHNEKIIFVYGGSGSIDSAASTQMVISNLNPKIIINIGSTSGFYKRVKLFDLVVAKNTFLYDFSEEKELTQINFDKYRTEINVDSNFKIPDDIIPSNIISTNSKLETSKISKLPLLFNASDPESGSIARICQNNNVQVMILKGISTIILSENNNSYVKISSEKNSEIIIPKIINIIKTFHWN